MVDPPNLTTAVDNKAIADTVIPTFCATDNDVTALYAESKYPDDSTFPFLLFALFDDFLDFLFLVVRGLVAMLCAEFAKLALSVEI